VSWLEIFILKLVNDAALLSPSIRQFFGNSGAAARHPVSATIHTDVGFVVSNVAASRVLLRVKFLLKTDSGYLKHAVVTLFNLANPGNSLRYTQWSALLVSTLARSRGPGARQAEGL